MGIYKMSNEDRHKGMKYMGYATPLLHEGLNELLVLNQSAEQGILLRHLFFPALHRVSFRTL